MNFSRGALAAAVLAAGGCGRATTHVEHTAPRAPVVAVVTSNILRADYAGSKACESCHAEVYAKWADSPMRRMTRQAPAAAIRAPFDGTTFRFKGDEVTMEEHDGRRYMRVGTRRAGAHLYRVTKVIGGRYREDFVGHEVAGTEPDSPVVGDPHDEPVLPASYLLFAKTWRYKGYSVMVKERPRIEKGGAPWQKTCILCHNTAPLLTSMYDDLGGVGAYQGSLSDHLLPRDRLPVARIADAPGLGRALGAEIGFLEHHPPMDAGGDMEALLARSIKATRQHFAEPELVEVGIGCEACHGGSREHVENPARRPSYDVRSPLVAVAPPTRWQGLPQRAPAINRVCARCHTVLFSHYPYTWEGGLRSVDPGDTTALYPAGGSTINSGEARDFLLGACSGKMSCTDCHDPHAEDTREKLDALATVAGNRVCKGCHAQFEGQAALTAHTHHAPEGEGSACLSCHMPRKNTGLAYRLTRYHRIGSPSDPTRVERDRPLECALCHATKSVSSLVDTMERWWGRRYDRAALQGLYGADLAVDALTSTLTRGKPHERITAAAVLGEKGSPAAALGLAPLLGDEYPLVRYYARSAIEGLLHRPMPIDPDGEAESNRTEANAWVRGALATPRAP